jgi:hypothetical protein
MSSRPREGELKDPVDMKDAKAAQTPPRELNWGEYEVQ